jgi:defect in organelle trafficking protein DotC
MRFRYLCAVSALTLAVAGCSTTSTSPPVDAVKPATAAPLRADVNSDYSAGSVSIPTSETASLDQVIAKTREAPKKPDEKENEDRLRLPAMQEAHTAYGAQAGLAYATRQINKKLQSDAGSLTQTYDFKRLMIQGPNNSMLLPPVIVEAQDAWEASDASKTLRIADKVYEIVDQTRFTPVVPLWQTYLIADFDEPPKPPEQLLPRDEDEQKAVERWTREGWKKGEEQAEEIFQANLNRLTRDFTGMVRYRALLEEGKVSGPTVGDTNMGTTGTGQDMRENDRLMRITQDPQLQVQNRNWVAPVTTSDNSGEQVGIPENQTNVEAAPKSAPKATTPPKKKVAPKKQTRPAPKPVDKPTTSGGDRF